MKIERMHKVISILVLIVLASGVLHTGAAEERNDPGFDIPGHRVPAPAFTLTDINGKTESLDRYHGKLVLLNFWATWCPPCREEMPSLQTLYHSLESEGLVVLAIAADRGNKNGIIKFAGKLALDFPVLLDPDGDVRNAYEVTGLPMTYLIGRDGKISARKIGSLNWSDTEVLTFIREQLMESSVSVSRITSTARDPENPQT